MARPGYDGDIDLSLLEAADQEEVLERFRAVSRPDRQPAQLRDPQSNGLALLAAWCFEVLQEMHDLGK